MHVSDLITNTCMNKSDLNHVPV